MNTHRVINADNGIRLAIIDDEEAHRYMIARMLEIYNPALLDGLGNGFFSTCFASYADLIGENKTVRDFDVFLVNVNPHDVTTPESFLGIPGVAKKICFIGNIQGEPELERLSQLANMEKPLIKPVVEKEWLYVFARLYKRYISVSQGIPEHLLQT